MAFQFPPGPAVNQTFTPVAGVTYRWSGTAWHLIAGPGAFISQADADLRYASLTNPAFTVPVRHADGTLAAPGIAWANDPNSGFAREADGSVTYASNAVAKWNWDLATGLFNVLGTVKGQTVQSDFDVSVGRDLGVTGTSTLKVTKVAQGYNGVIGNATGAPFLIEASGAVWPGIGLHKVGTVAWSIGLSAGSDLYLGTTAATGPSAIGTWSMVLQQNGDLNARSFVARPTVATVVQPLTLALTNVLKLHGVRYFDTETQRDEIGLKVDDVELAFPEALSEATPELGKGINYMALMAPMVEAIRELTARVAALEAKVGP